jgi:hypothetical protein
MDGRAADSRRRKDNNLSSHTMSVIVEGDQRAGLPSDVFNQLFYIAGQSLLYMM